MIRGVSLAKTRAYASRKSRRFSHVPQRFLWFERELTNQYSVARSCDFRFSKNRLVQCDVFAFPPLLLWPETMSLRYFARNSTNANNAAFLMASVSRTYTCLLLIFYDWTEKIRALRGDEGGSDKRTSTEFIIYLCLINRVLLRESPGMKVPMRTRQQIWQTIEFSSMPLRKFTHCMQSISRFLAMLALPNHILNRSRFVDSHSPPFSRRKPWKTASLIEFSSNSAWPIEKIWSNNWCAGPEILIEHMRQKRQ